MTANLTKTRKDTKLLIVSGERRGESVGRSKYNEIEIHRTNAVSKHQRTVHQVRLLITVKRMYGKSIEKQVSHYIIS